MATTLWVKVFDNAGHQLNAYQSWVNSTSVADWNKANGAGGDSSMISGAVAGKSYAICVQAEGYQQKSQSVIAQASGTQIVNFALSPVPVAQTGKLTFTFTPETLPGLRLASGSGPEAFDLTGTGAPVVISALSFGSYQITISATGYQSQEVSVNFAKDGQVQPVTMAPDADAEMEDDGSENTDSGNYNALIAAAGNITAAKDPSEAVYSNTAFEGYFTGAQCRVYIGNLFIDEVQTIQYVVQSNAIPVFGYASRYADAFAQGRSMVQGQLVLNYISENYLYAVLDEYRAKSFSADTTPDDDDAAGLKQAIAASSALGSTSLKTGGSVVDLNGALDERISALIQNPEAVKKYKQLMKKEGFDPVYANPTYQDIVFDIVIEIGTGTSRTFRKIEKAKLTTNEQVIDQSGNVIGESYGFIGRRLR